NRSRAGYHRRDHLHALHQVDSDRLYPGAEGAMARAPRSLHAAPDRLDAGVARDELRVQLRELRSLQLRLVPIRWPVRHHSSLSEALRFRDVTTGLGYTISTPRHVGFSRCTTTEATQETLAMKNETAQQQDELEQRLTREARFHDEKYAGGDLYPRHYAVRPT